MSLIQKLFKIKKQEEFLTINEIREKIDSKQPIPLSISSASKDRKFIVKPRTIFGKKNKGSKIITTHTLGKNILETGKVPTPVYTKSREYDSDVSMFH